MSEAAVNLEASNEAQITPELHEQEQKQKNKFFSVFTTKDQTVTAKEMYEFLPAAIEVEQTPASPAGRAILWAIVILFTIAATWAFFGKVDIVAVAQGKVIPSEHIKHIQPLEAAKIKAIHVKEGQHVKQGELLITFDNTQTQADVARLKHEVQEQSATVSRLQAYEKWLATGLEKVISKQPIHTVLSSINTDNAQNIFKPNLFKTQQAELLSKLRTFSTEKQKLIAEQEMTHAEVVKKQRVLPILAERVEALENMYKKDYGSKLKFLELTQTLIEEQQDLAVQLGKVKQQTASLQSVDDQSESLMAEQRFANLSTLEEVQLKLAGLKQELIKAQQRNQQQTLVAPLDGQVQQLAVHTLGGVVTPAQALMVIVPKQSQMEVEAMLLNKDIGFVHEGQSAEIKIDTFNFTKYGFIDAEIGSISDDAIQDENLGLVYTARFKLKKEQLNVEGRMVNLSPGMSVTAEVKTGKRRLIEYFLSPLLRYKQESLGER